MKYFCFSGNFENIPNSLHNLSNALLKIGELDPYNIKKTSLKINHISKQRLKTKLTEKDLINRGILNVRYRLNRHLGKSGKYTNNMIKKTAHFKINESKITSSLPKIEYIKIAITTYFILWEVDRKYCEKLLKIEQGDNYPTKNIGTIFNPIKAIVPIQTDIVLRSIGQNQEITNFINDVKYRVLTRR